MQCDIHYFSDARPLKQILHCSKDSKRKYHLCWFDCKLDGSIQFFVKESLEKHFFELFFFECANIFLHQSISYPMLILAFGGNFDIIQTPRKSQITIYSAQHITIVITVNHTTIIRMSLKGSFFVISISTSFTHSIGKRCSQWCLGVLLLYQKFVQVYSSGIQNTMGFQNLVQKNRQTIPFEWNIQFLKK